METDGATDACGAHMWMWVYPAFMYIVLCAVRERWRSCVLSALLGPGLALLCCGPHMPTGNGGEFITVADILGFTVCRAGSSSCKAVFTHTVRSLCRFQAGNATCLLYMWLLCVAWALWATWAGRRLTTARRAEAVDRAEPAERARAEPAERAARAKPAERVARAEGGVYGTTCERNSELPTLKPKPKPKPNDGGRGTQEPAERCSWQNAVVGCVGWCVTDSVLNISNAPMSVPEPSPLACRWFDDTAEQHKRLRSMHR